MTYDITRNNLTSENLLLGAVTDDRGLHGNVTLEGRDDVGSLLLLVPTDDGVEHKNTDDDTEINPGAKTSSEENSNLHD